MHASSDQARVDLPNCQELCCPLCCIDSCWSRRAKRTEPSFIPLSVASYNPAFRAMFNEMTAVLDFILWHTTLVAFDIFLRMSLILYEFGSSFWSKRETWRKFKKTASLSGAVDAVVTITLPTLRVHAVPLMTAFLSNVGNRGISSPCRRTRVFLCIFVPWPLTVCMAVVKR